MKLRQSAAMRFLLLRFFTPLLCLPLALIIILAYLNSEDTIYFWDLNNYQNLTQKALSILAQSKRSYGIGFLLLVRASTAWDYSLVPTLPLIPFASLNQNRLMFVGSMILIYLFSYALSIGRLGSQLFPDRTGRTFWISTCFAFLNPLLWAATFRGYPDAGAAALISLALSIYIDRSISFWKKAAIVSFLLTLAFLFRRHFLYDVIAFFVSIGLCLTLFVAIRRRKDEISDAFKQYLAIIVLFLATTVFLGLPFLTRVIQGNFGQIYTSYEVSPLDGIFYFGTQFGWLILALSIFGFVLNASQGSSNGEGIGFFVVYNFVSLVAWILVAKQLGVQYTLHFTTFVTLGFTALFCYRLPAQLLPYSKSFQVLIALVVAGNFFAGLSPVFSETYHSEAVIRRQGWARELLAANYPPLKYPDVAGLKKLVITLRELDSRAPILIAASSFLLNDSIVTSADRRFFPSEDPLNVLSTPQIDSRDGDPLAAMRKAEIIVVALPVQYHLLPERQKKLKAIVDTFYNDWRFVKGFTLSTTLNLHKNIEVRVYKRQKLISSSTADLIVRRIQDELSST